MYVDNANRSSSNLKGNQDGDNKSEGMGGDGIEQYISVMNFLSLTIDYKHF